MNAKYKKHLTSKAPRLPVKMSPSKVLPVFLESYWCSFIVTRTILTLLRQWAWSAKTGRTVNTYQSVSSSDYAIKLSAFSTIKCYVFQYASKWAVWSTWISLQSPFITLIIINLALPVISRSQQSTQSTQFTRPLQSFSLLSSSILHVDILSVFLSSSFSDSSASLDPLGWSMNHS